MKNTLGNMASFGVCLLLASDQLSANSDDGRFNGLLGAIEEGKLLAPDGMAADAFGLNVSLSGDWALVGSSRHDAVADDAGAAYVYQFNGVEWTYFQKLTAADGAAGDRFGATVSIDGEVAMIGAFRDDDNGGDSGAVYVFDFSGSSWSETQKITAADGANGDWFGYAISQQGGRVAIAAHKDNEADRDNSGAVYMYAYDGMTWQPEQKLMAADGQAFDQFGIAVSLDVDRLLVGAYTVDDGGDDKGAAYIFDFDGVEWSQSQKLQSTQGAAGGFFGYAVSLFEDRALIGAYEDTGLASGSGAAYVFALDGNNWTQQQRLVADETFPVQAYGIAVDFSGDRALIGASKAHASGFISGLAYVYDYQEASWSVTEKLLGADTVARDELGVSVSLSDGRALLGAHRDGDLGTDAGSAYVFDVPAKLSVTVSGLAADNMVTLVNQGVDDLLVVDNGRQTFATALFQGSDYAVTVSAPPSSPNQSCEVISGNGVLLVSEAPDIQVVCVTTPYLVAGAAKGLFAGNQLVIQNNGVDTLTLSQDGAFVFPVAITDQQAYAVSIIQLPSNPIQPCQVINGTGKIAGGDVNDVVIICTPGDDYIFGAGFDFTSN